MPPKQKGGGGGGAPKKNVAEEVEETLQAVVCFLSSWVNTTGCAFKLADILALFRSWRIPSRRDLSLLPLTGLGCVLRDPSFFFVCTTGEPGY